MNLIQQAKNLQTLDNVIYQDIREAYSHLKLKLYDTADEDTKELLSTIGLKIQSMETQNFNRKKFYESLEAQAQSNLADYLNQNHLS